MRRSDMGPPAHIKRRDQVHLEATGGPQQGRFSVQPILRRRIPVW